MYATLETRLNSISDTKTRASVRLSFSGWSFTISDILIHRNQDNKWILTMPLSNYGGNMRPAISLQGRLKEAAFRALSEDHQTMRLSGERLFHNTREFPAEAADPAAESTDKANT